MIKPQNKKQLYSEMKAIAIMDILKGYSDISLIF